MDKKPPFPACSCHQTTNFGLYQVQSIYRQHVKHNSIFRHCLWECREVCGEKGENGVYQHFLHFPQGFQKVISAIQGHSNSTKHQNILLSSNWKDMETTNKLFAKIMISVFDRVGNIVGKGENAGYQHFFLFLHCFQKASSSGSLERIVW